MQTNQAHSSPLNPVSPVTAPGNSPNVALTNQVNAYEKIDAARQQQKVEQQASAQLELLLAQERMEKERLQRENQLQAWRLEQFQYVEAARHKKREEQLRFWGTAALCVLVGITAVHTWDKWRNKER